MYKNYDLSDEHISLHDCRATKMKWVDGVLTFYFEDGFWICPGHESISLEQAVCTDASEVRFHLLNQEESDITIYIFTERKNGKIMREEWELGKFVDAINNGSFEVEFLYQYKGYQTQIFECCLCLDKKPYHKECELKISTNQVTYCWNRLCEEHTW